MSSEVIKWKIAVSRLPSLDEKSIERAAWIACVRLGE